MARADSTAKAAEATPQSPVEIINARIRQAWQDQGLAPSQEASDGEWCRRVYLDLIGRVPTVDEVNAYLADRKRGKRQRLVDRLLGERVPRRVRAAIGRRSGRICSSVARAAWTGGRWSTATGMQTVSARGAGVQQAVRPDDRASW